MIRPQSLRRTTAYVVAATLLLTLALAPATTSAADKETEAFWKKLFGKQLKLKGSPQVYTDATGDGVDAATGQVVGGPGYADGTDFAILVTKLRKAQVNALSKLQRGKKTQPIVGASASPKAGQTWVFFGARTAEKLPPGVPGGVQLQAAFDGANAVPIYGGGANDPVAGIENLIISGQYDNFDLLLSGATNTSGTARGARPDYNNTPARTSGFVQDRAWVIGAPLPKGAEHGRFTFQVVDGGKQIVDPMSTPDGVNSFALRGPAVPEGLCYSAGIFSIQDADGQVLEYAIELALESDQPLTDEQLAAISVVGNDGAPVPGGWHLFPEVGGAYGNFTAPPGPAQTRVDSWASSKDQREQFLASQIDGMALDLSGTESGLAIGTRQCALLPPVAGGIQESVGEALGAYLGLDSEAIEQFSTRGGDGSDVRIVFSPEAQRAIGVLVAGNRPTTVADYERMSSSSFCDPEPAGIGGASIRVVCPDGTHRLFWWSPMNGPDGPLEFGRVFTIDLLPDADGAVEPMGFELPISADALGLVTSLEQPLLDWPPETPA